MKNKKILKNAILWTKDPFDNKTKEEVKYLINHNFNKIKDAFYQDLKFGTGGVRAIMGIGINRFNKYTIGRLTQGLSFYLKKYFSGKISVVIAYDVRHNSKYFSEIIANIFTANNIYVNIFENFRPTPELSFAVRYLKCQAGIMLTASHNPPDYNGYKIYFEDGGQIVSPHDNNIIKEIAKLNFSDINFCGNKKLIKIIGKEIDEKFIENVVKFGSYKKEKEKNNNLKIVFTPIHGTTIKIIPEVLNKAGFNSLFIVKEQAFPNGDFPTVKLPNPEESETLNIAINKANKINADLVIGTDPDGDRLGIACRNRNGKIETLNGNETNTLLINYLLKLWYKLGKIKGKEFIATTIVSSDLFSKLSNLYNVECKIGLTGFKWIAKMINDTKGKKKFICGGEESFGFMIDDFLRDKDSITTSLLISEIAAQAKKKNKTLFDLLAEIYLKTGFYLEDLISIYKNGENGLKIISSLMNYYRNSPPKFFNKSKVIQIDDYKISISKNLITGKKQKINLPKSNVLIFYTDNKIKIACRPSGTEPKIKYYISVQSPLGSIKDYEVIKKKLQKKIQILKKYILLKISKYL